jgi:hypothetical protein
MPRLPISLEGIVGHGTFEVTDKLDECRFFLNLMKRTKDWARFRWLTSAYLNAARAALDWLAFSVYYARTDDEGEIRADREAIEKLEKYLILKRVPSSGKVYASPRDPTLRELCKHRKVTAHEGPLAIRPEKVTGPEEFVFRDGGQRVIRFADHVLKVLSKIQHELRPWV